MKTITSTSLTTIFVLLVIGTVFLADKVEAGAPCCYVGCQGMGKVAFNQYECPGSSCTADMCPHADEALEPEAHATGEMKMEGKEGLLA